MADSFTIDITPTWGEVGNIYMRFAESGEREAARAYRDQAAKASAFAEAFKTIHPDLPPELLEKADAAFRAELRKQIPV